MLSSSWGCARPDVSGLALTIFAGATGLSSYVAMWQSSGPACANTSSVALNVLGLVRPASRRSILFIRTRWFTRHGRWSVLALAYLYRRAPGFMFELWGSHPKPLT